MKIGVVGAGIIGTSIAYHLGKAGAQVTVFDIGDPGNGVSSTTFACLNAFGQAQADLAFRLDAIRFHTTIAREIGSQDLLNITGTLRLASSENEAAKLSANAEAMRDQGSRVERLTVSAAAELEPLIRAHSAIDSVLISDEGWINSRALCERLAEASEKLFEVRCKRERIVGIEGNGSTVQVSHARGKDVFDSLVLAAGNETNTLLASAGLNPTQLKTVPGPLVELLCPKGGHVLNHVVYADDLHVRPGDKGGLLAGVSAIAEEAPLHERLEKERLALVRGGDCWITRFCEMPQKWSIGARPMPLDGLPIIGRLEECDEIYVAVMHGGVTLGPLVGRLVAQDIAEEHTDLRLMRYHCRRFLKETRQCIGPALSVRPPGRSSS